MLEGKTIIVTGCSSGIGRETARQIRGHGGRVIGVDLNAPEEGVDEFITADLSDRNAIDRLVDTLPEGTDGLANIAGLPPTAPADTVLLVNLVGLKYLTQRLAGELGGGASIVNVSSLAGTGWPKSVNAIRASENLDFDNVGDFIATHNVGSDGGRSYFFSKEALTVWTMQSRWAWRERGIRMNCVSPGPVETPIFADFVATLGARDSLDKNIMERIGTPSDVAPVICFLLSDMTHWIRGANIPIDGGMFAHLQCKLHQL